MKKIYILLLLIFSAGAGVAFGADEPKPDGDWEQEMLDFKIKYLCQEMDLTGEKKEKFSELYRQLSTERNKIFRESHAVKRKVQRNKKATEADYQRAGEAMEQGKEKVDRLERSYDEKFKTFLSAKQIFKMKEGEEKFRRKLMEMRGKKHRHKKTK